MSRSLTLGARVRSEPVASFVAALGVCAPAGGRIVQTIGDDGPQKLRFAQNLAIGPTGSIYVLDASGTFPDPRVLVNVYSPAGETLSSWQVPSAPPVLRSRR